MPQPLKRPAGTAQLPRPKRRCAALKDTDQELPAPAPPPLLEKPVPPAPGVPLGMPPLVPDAHMLVTFMRRLLDRLSETELVSLKSWCQAGCFVGAPGAGRAAASSNISIGTMCSGTDSPVLTLEAFCQAANAMWPDLSVDCKHLWSCEKDPAKQTFLRDMFSSAHLL